MYWNTFINQPGLEVREEAEIIGASIKEASLISPWRVAAVGGTVGARDSPRSGSPRRVVTEQAGVGGEEHPVCASAECGHQNPPGSKWCNACGKRLPAVEVAPSLIPPGDSSGAAGVEDSEILNLEIEDSLEILGFRIGSGLLHKSDAAWTVLQDQVEAQLGATIKHEIVEMDTKDVYFTQRHCSDYFRSGVSLTETTAQLRDWPELPLSVDSFILDVIQARVRPDWRRGTRRMLVYYSLDHRRLKCMKDAGVSRIRVRILISDNPAVDNLMTKAMESVGLRTDIVVKHNRHLRR